MSEAEHSFGITLEQVSDFEFRIRFDETGIPDLITDETSPLGHDAGPNPSRMLAAAIANCQAASLLFALRKYKNAPEKMRATARLAMERNEQGRLRISHVGVDLQLSEKGEAMAHLDRVLAQFEDFCIVTQSVRQGIKVDVTVHDGEGNALHASGKGPAGA
ncbi:OsmC family protein [Dyella sp. C11]|uniref:OsmC family protein n=1 Tax=Dyella sp. C11 TaxID=2126991 RepID=UPI000D654C27|nr:OsmC family protein [Dyella sp. C11]